MRELIFNIGNIFNNHNQNGCLQQYDSDFFHIPAYQRGFKWASTKNGAVTILLQDLWNAFLAYNDQERKEYYLQYITVKKITIKKEKCLEVIDGQQRLTTISILLAVLSSKISTKNISANKLDYAIRTNFFVEYIYNTNALNQILETTWDDFITKKELNKQDLFYMFTAIQKCNIFLSTKENQLEQFYNYLINNVKLIVNSVEKHIDSETVFKNLNSNKVPLTEAELIKGLLITKIGRQRSDSFKEVINIRYNIGKFWDEIAIWANKKTINSFYFNNENDAMQELLKLTVFSLENDHTKLSSRFSKKDYPLFNFLLEYNNFEFFFDKLKEIKDILDNWYNTTNIYNLLGYVRFAKKSKNNNLKFLKKLLDTKTKSETIELLTKEKEILLQVNIDDLTFEDTPDEIHHVLLALSVFIEGQKNIRFNFYEYKNQKWSLEHVFPQTPEGKKKILLPEHKKAIINILGKNMSAEVRSILELATRTEEEKQIYYKALRDFSALNGIGNMCLLTGGDNASNGNKFFNEKRTNILKRIQTGSFVPKHTFDVFSKMFTNANTNQMNSWTIEDINAHKKYIIKALNLKKNIDNII